MASQEFAQGKGYRILVADDDSGVRAALALLLHRFGYIVDLVATAEEALTKVRGTTYSVLLLDMNFGSTTTGEEGLELLGKVKIFAAATPVILFTAWGTIALAVEGMRAGAFDFITKPWDNRLLIDRIETAIHLRESEQMPINGHANRSGIIGESEELLSVLRLAERVAPTQASVLILGESGTGKELIAQFIHEHSQRAQKPFVKVNLGGLSPLLFESEMFGHKRGAFTDAYHDREGRIALAQGGTIFLDEIGDLDPTCQVKLLRVLQDQQYEVLGDSKSRHADIRVISATNADLPALVAEKRFREDLLYRINLITITLAPLRKRRSDIPLLASHFISAYCTNNKIPQKRLANSALTALNNYPWPGNIRELKNCIERAVLLCEGALLDGNTIQLALSQNTLLTSKTHESLNTGTLKGIEADVIRASLEQHHGNLSRVAEDLGISRAALYRRLAKYGIKAKES